ncbi:alpha/beta hydrolase [Arenibaculum pallidiluteum]|uniref:alpha/beta hydrolase n=1 Tax=Arenibaculum pallidiluteum TaxID=2812559 RepID=UPI001A95C50B|nr:alpha/beta hydrolase [Arenibaculum pallidiluteum]
MPYRDFATQEAIDREYNPRLSVAGIDEVMAGWARRSEALRANASPRLGLRFGPTLAEYLDVFPCGTSGAPIHLFIHGGYWRALSARDFSFVAEAPLARGQHCVVVNYALCPQVTIPEIVRQVRGALAWTWENAASFGGDRDSITVSGHSAGGHLTARLLETAWERDYGLPAAPVRGAVAISGLFDLEPLRWSWLQPALQITPGTVERESPVRRPHRVAVPFVAAVGGAESAEFRRQSADYATQIAAAGLPARCLEVPGCDHFSVLEMLADPAGTLWQAVEAL